MINMDYNYNNSYDNGGWNGNGSGGNDYGGVGRQRMSVGEWMLCMFVSAIPLVGLIMLIIWATGNGKAQKCTELQNWSAASLIFTAIAIILFIISICTGASVLSSLARSLY